MMIENYDIAVNIYLEFPVCWALCSAIYTYHLI